MMLCALASWFRLINGFSPGHEQFTVVGFYPHGLIVSDGRHFNVHKSKIALLFLNAVMPNRPGNSEFGMVGSSMCPKVNTYKYYARYARGTVAPLPAIMYCKSTV